MAQSDAALYQALQERLDKVEDLLQRALDKLQELLAREPRDMMHEVYPPKDNEAA